MSSTACGGKMSRKGSSSCWAKCAVTARLTISPESFRRRRSLTRANRARIWLGCSRCIAASPPRASASIISAAGRLHSKRVSMHIQKREKENRNGRQDDKGRHHRTCVEDRGAARNKGGGG